MRIAIVGAGNCASSLIQGIEFYRRTKSREPIPGLMHLELGGYHVGDIDCVAAFDVAKGKVGRDLADALSAPPNNTIGFAELRQTGVEVRRGPTHDGIGHYLQDVIAESPAAVDNVTKTLRATGAEIVISYLPVGSEVASRWYAEQALAAGCGFVNCIPVFIASDAGWRARFEARRLPVIGDDVKSQVGATIIHRVLANLFRERGVRVDRTYQLNFGGNSDFRNMLERERLLSKKRSKTDSLTSQLAESLSDADAHIGPSDFVPWLTDRKWCHIRIEGTSFGNLPLNCELKLEVWDSPNSAGV
ncbi:MAG: inositol-3-phosphate synthase, partial [Alphaproteobacteria bacterium]|nr:inositol-3-phosphate synthase [Alphaproteobacteria bacterium]